MLNTYQTNSAYETMNRILRTGLYRTDLNGNAFMTLIYFLFHEGEEAQS